MRYEIKCIGDYHKVWLNREAGIRNPKFDLFSKFIWKLKDKTTNGLVYFSKIVEPVIPKNVVLCSVPSSDSSNTCNGIRLLAQRLALANRIDGTSCLVRTRTIQKASHGGPRNIRIHLDSITVKNGELVTNKPVYILDDVTTTGSSLQACAQLLEPFEPASITCLALGQTVWE
jgi:predicted amidophosphoribosyltransferase